MPEANYSRVIRKLIEKIFSKIIWTSCSSSNKQVSILPRDSLLTSAWKSKVERRLIMFSYKALNILKFVDIVFIKLTNFTASSRTRFNSLEGS